jgi:2-polyprenyl-3-methyl-5-hydroxy-6-metoxy-1,4-benzoquinol methylase
LTRIAQIIPNNAKVLDIGAGNGLLALILSKIHDNIIIDGIEPNPYAAKIASKNYRQFYHGFAQEYKDMIREERYDYVVLADVIEHVDNPQAFLQDLFSDMPGETKVILTTPNVAFGSVRLALLNGQFNYVDSGILEKSHLRFFTLQTIIDLISSVDMKIERIYFLQRDFSRTEIPVKRTILNFFCIFSMLSDDLSSTYQFLLVLTRDEVLTEKIYFGRKFKLFDKLILEFERIFKSLV